MNFCSKLSTFHKRTNIIPLLIVLLSIEKLPIFKNCSFPNFSANLWLWIPCCFGPYTWPSLVYHWWKSILISLTFSKDSTFSLCLCHVFFRISFSSGWVFTSVFWWYYWSDHPLKTPGECCELHWVVVLPVWCPSVKSLSLSLILSVWCLFSIVELDAQIHILILPLYLLIIVFSFP